MKFISYLRKRQFSPDDAHPRSPGPLFVPSLEARGYKPGQLNNTRRVDFKRATQSRHEGSHLAVRFIEIIAKLARHLSTSFPGSLFLPSLVARGIVVWAFEGSKRLPALRVFK